MKIALLGYGKMGQLVEQAAQAKGHQIVARFSRHLGMVQDRKHDLAQADLAIDFSLAACVLPHLEICLTLDKPLVIGTTGWEEQCYIAKEMVEQGKGSCLHAPNFSIGVYLFQQIVAYAAALMQPFKDYDVSGIEYHHRQKQDKPSGTAKALSRNLLQNMPRAHDFSFSSVRCGHIPGTHTLYFDSPVDTLVLTHEARNRQGFAYGAIVAAEWLSNRKGFFSIDDMMQDHFGGKQI
jgi:4-hydroxy-tetrahydrodipicolinate reductase